MFGVSPSQTFLEHSSSRSNYQSTLASRYTYIYTYYGIYTVHIDHNQHTPHTYIYTYIYGYSCHNAHMYIYIYMYICIICVYIYISALSLDSPCLNATAAKVVKSPRIKARTAFAVLHFEWLFFSCKTPLVFVWDFFNYITSYIVWHQYDTIFE